MKKVPAAKSRPRAIKLTMVKVPATAPLFSQKFFPVAAAVVGSISSRSVGSALGATLLVGTTRVVLGVVMGAKTAGVLVVVALDVVVEEEEVLRVDEDVEVVEDVDEVDS